MGEQQYVHRCIYLINNTSRPERTDVYLSMNHSSISAREDSPGRGENLRQRRERTLGRRSRVSDGGKSERRHILQQYRKYLAEITPRTEDYLVRRERRAAVCLFRHHNLVNNPSRPQHAAVYVSMNHSSILAIADSSGGGEAKRLRSISTAGPSRTLHNIVPN